MAAKDFKLLSMWMLAHQDIEQRRTLLAWHDTQGTGDDLREMLTAQHESWSKLKTIKSRQTAYGKAVSEAKDSGDPSMIIQANQREAAAMKRLAEDRS